MLSQKYSWQFELDLNIGLYPNAIVISSYSEKSNIYFLCHLLKMCDYFCKSNLIQLALMYPLFENRRCSVRKEVFFLKKAFPRTDLFFFPFSQGGAVRLSLRRSLMLLSVSLINRAENPMVSLYIHVILILPNIPNFK
ncbi:MAG TPA: hypothetical protein DCR40_12165 [Prolixibacteraceae bacterium]|nr:hypothetical protein [Prolixibacteraceae bacterium]